MQLTRVPFACLVMLLVAAPSVHAQVSFDAARDLSASAEYEKALAMLDGLSAQPDRGDDVELYRALCLLALGQQEDADRAVETMVRRDPLYRVPDDLAPRMRTAFGEAKKRLLPAIVQEHYRSAKAAFDDRNFSVAADSFQLVLDALADPSVKHASSQPPLSDIQVLATGFRELSVKAIPPPPPAAAFVAVPPPVAPTTLRIYNGTEPGVVVPVAIAQEFPKFPGRVPPGGIAGAVEIVIDQNGAVEWASMQTAVLSGYDDIVVAAARNWRYQPARVNGAPVKFRKQIQIKIVPDRAGR